MVIFLWCILVNVVLRAIFGCSTYAFGFLPCSIRLDEGIVSSKERETVVPLPERDIAETKFLELGEVSVGALMVPLRAPCKSTALN